MIENFFYIKKHVKKACVFICFTGKKVYNPWQSMNKISSQTKKDSKQGEKKIKQLALKDYRKL